MAHIVTWRYCGSGWEIWPFFWICGYGERQVPCNSCRRSGNHSLTMVESLLWVGAKSLYTCLIQCPMPWQCEDQHLMVTGHRSWYQISCLGRARVGGFWLYQRNQMVRASILCNSSPWERNRRASCQNEVTTAWKLIQFKVLNCIINLKY